MEGKGGFFGRSWPFQAFSEALRTRHGNSSIPGKQPSFDAWKLPEAGNVWPGQPLTPGIGERSPSSRGAKRHGDPGSVSNAAGSAAPARVSRKMAPQRLERIESAPADGRGPNLLKPQDLALGPGGRRLPSASPPGAERRRPGNANRVELRNLRAAAAPEDGSVSTRGAGLYRRRLSSRCACRYIP